MWHPHQMQSSRLQGPFTHTPTPSETCCLASCSKNTAPDSRCCFVHLPRPRAHSQMPSLRLASALSGCMTLNKFLPFPEPHVTKADKTQLALPVGLWTVEPQHRLKALAKGLSMPLFSSSLLTSHSSFFLLILPLHLLTSPPIYTRHASKCLSLHPSHSLSTGSKHFLFYLGPRGSSYLKPHPSSSLALPTAPGVFVETADVLPSLLHTYPGRICSSLILPELGCALGHLCAPLLPSCLLMWEG